MAQKQILTLDKQLQLDEYEFPTVTYRITSQSERAFKLRLKEQLPEPCKPSELRFHSEDAFKWTLNDGSMAFEDQIEPEETRVTVCGVKTDAHEQLDGFSGPPMLEIAPTEADDGDGEEDWKTISEDLFEYRDLRPSNKPESTPIVASDGGTQQSGDGTRAIRDTSKSDSDSPTEENESTESLNAAIPPASDNGTQPSTDMVDESKSGDLLNESQIQSEEIVERFLTALQENELSDAQLETLHEVLGVDAGESVNARIEHCQTRLSDLTAYIDALEEFLDEEGSGQQLIEEVQTDLEDIEEQVSTVQSEVSTIETQQEELREHLTEIDEELSTLERIEADVESLETQLDDTSTSLEAEIETLDKSIEDLEDWQDKVASVFAGSATENV
jgi:prefoldin subunit 5